MFATRLIPALLLGLAAVAPAQVPNPTATPELAQDRGHDVHTPKHDSVDAQEVPVTRALNNEVETVTAAREIGGEVDQEQYRLDMAAYDSAVMANKAEAMRDEARHSQQQRAYADAMVQWRAQTEACEKGKLTACKLPTPNPASFY